MFLDFIRLLNAVEKTKVRMYSQHYDGFLFDITFSMKEIYMMMGRLCDKKSQEEVESIVKCVQYYNQLTGLNCLFGSAINSTDEYETTVKSVVNGAVHGNMGHFRHLAVQQELLGPLTKGQKEAFVTYLEYIVEGGVAAFIGKFKSDVSLQKLPTMQFLLSSLQEVNKKNDTAASFCALLKKFSPLGEKVNCVIAYIDLMGQASVQPGHLFGFELYRHFISLHSDAGYCSGMKRVMTNIGMLLSKCIGTGPNNALGKIDLSVIHMNDYLKECDDNNQFFGDIQDEHTLNQLRKDLKSFFSPMQMILVACQQMKNQSLSCAKIEEIFTRFFVDRYLKNPLLSHEISCGLNHENFLRKSNRILLIRENKVIRQCSETSAYALESFSLDDISDEHIGYFEYPAIRVMLEGPDSVIHFSQLDRMMSKVRSGDDYAMIKQIALSEIISEAKKNIEIDCLREIMSAMIDNNKLSLTDFSVRVQYINILHHTSVFDEFKKAILQNQHALIQSNFSKWQSIAHHERFKPRPLEEVFKDFQHQSDVKYPLSRECVKKIFSQYQCMEKMSGEFAGEAQSTLFEKVQAILKSYPSTTDSDVIEGLSEAHTIELLAILRELYKQVYGIFPYNLQMLNCLALLEHVKAVAQIKTGEGKSTIITLLAAFFALKGHRVDIITTSEDLAVRDAKKFEAFYRLLKLNCGHIEYKETTCGHFMPIILYGQTTSFEFVHLFGMTKLRFDRVRDAERPYDVVLVDEVDSMFLDTALNGARIANPTSDSVEHFTHIWAYVNQCTYPTIDGMRDYLMRRQEDDAEGVVYSLNDLTDWLGSAKTAKKKKLREDYVILPNSEGIKEIVIVDKKHTGALQEGQVWSKGLHQIVAVKHRIPIKRKSTMVASMSHVNFFKLYQNRVIGLTGTLGEDYVRQELQRVYGIELMYDSPRYRESQKCGVEHQLCINIENQYTALKADVREMVRQSRPVLVICEHIRETEEVKKVLSELSESGACRIQMYNAVQEDDAESVLAFAGTQSTVTIATNTAGRGADIVPSPQSEEAGGLHVIVLFPTINMRVQEQAFGRTGRQGRQGTFHYVFDEPRLIKALRELGSRYFNSSSTITIDSWLELREHACRDRSENRIERIEYEHEKYMLLEFLASLPDCHLGMLLGTWASKYRRIEAVVENSDDVDYLRTALFLQMHDIWSVLLKRMPHAAREPIFTTPLHYAIATDQLHAVKGLLSLPFARQYFFVPQANGGKLISDFKYSNNVEIRDCLAAYLNSQSDVHENCIYEMIGKLDISGLGDGIKERKLYELLSSFEMLIKPSFSMMFSTALKFLGHDELKGLLRKIIFNEKLSVYHLVSLINHAIVLSNTTVYAEFIQFVGSEGYEKIQDEMPRWQSMAHLEKYSEQPLSELIENFRPKSPTIDIRFQIEKSVLENKGELCGRIIDKGKDLMGLSDSYLHDYFQQLRKDITVAADKVAQESILVSAFAVIREVYKRQYNIYPYGLQVLNTLLVLSDHRYFAQIKTGEGKSTIIALMSALLVFRGEKVAVITTSGDLAVRDAEKFKLFYEKLGVSCRDNYACGAPSPDIYNEDIVYGTIIEFEFAYLYSALGQKGFVFDGSIHKRGVIVDECDSMMLDQMRNGAIISNAESKSGDQLYSLLWHHYITHIKDTIEDEDEAVANLKALLAENDYTYDDQRVSRWYRALYSADQYQKDVDYIVHEDNKKNRSIVIMDLDTGQMQIGLRWMNGVHAFVEVKEGLQAQAESMVSASIQHCTFLNGFKSIFGLTGTLGNRTARSSLQKLYGLNTYDSPRFRPCVARAYGDIVCSDYADKVAAMRNVVVDMIDEARPVLIICHSIRDVKSVQLELQPFVKEVNIYDGTQEKSADYILALAGAPGVVTIATNTAGRGADISPLPQTDDQGGLHVILFHAAKNSRILWQAYGRTGRQGRPGTFQMIVCRSELLHQLPNNFTVNTRHGARRILRTQCSGIPNDKLLKLYQYITDAGEGSVSTAMILHRQQMMLHDALKIYATLPNDIKKQLSDVWPCYYSVLHRIPPSASNPAGLHAYKNALSAPLVEFWNQHVEKLGSLLAECPEVVSCYHAFVEDFLREESQETVSGDGEMSALSGMDRSGGMKESQETVSGDGKKLASSGMDGSGSMQTSRTQTGFQFSGKRNDGSTELTLSESNEDQVKNSEEELAVMR